MTCQEFRNHLPDLLDRTLESRLLDEAKTHVDECAACRRALQREQVIGRTLADALARKAVEVSLSPESTQRILRAARSQPVGRTPARGVWRWLTANPLGVLAPAAVLLGVVLLSVQWARSRSAASRAATALVADTSGYSIDVPLPIDTHVFKIENGALIDAVISRVAIGHAHFPAVPARSRLSP